jgi:hypothetical protein
LHRLAVQENAMTTPQKWTGVGVRSYDDKQAGARLSQCAGCGLWFWFTKHPAPEKCIACRETGHGQ